MMLFTRSISLEEIWEKVTIVLNSWTVWKSDNYLDSPYRGGRLILWRGGRPIAKRRAGLLGRVASANGGRNSLVLASGCSPVRFDLDHSLFSGSDSGCQKSKSKAAGEGARATQNQFSGRSTNPRNSELVRRDAAEHPRPSLRDRTDDPRR